MNIERIPYDSYIYTLYFKKFQCNFSVCSGVYMLLHIEVGSQTIANMTKLHPDCQVRLLKRNLASIYNRTY